MLRLLSRSGWVCALAMLFALRCVAQATSQEDASTLRVYVNLIQIPVLVLNGLMHTQPRIPDKDFNVSIEGLGRVRPSHIRMEGDDPLNVVLIVDRSNRDESLWNDLPKSLHLLLASLQPHDRVTVLGFDGCKARRFGEEMPPFDAAQLTMSAKNVTEMKSYESLGRKRPPCTNPLGYWDLVMYSAKRLAAYPGRKLIVTLSGGEVLSAEASEKLHAALMDSSITLFPIVHGIVFSDSALPYSNGRRIGSGVQVQMMAQVNPGTDVAGFLALATQAEMSGGMLLSTSQRDFAKTLAQPIVLARGRYIIEFPRPDTLPAGNHVIQVADGHLHDFIRPAGASVPIADPKERLDPAVEHGALGAVPPDSLADGAAAAPAASVVLTPAPVAPAAAGSVVPAAAPASSAPPATVDPTDISGDLHSSR